MKHHDSKGVKVKPGDVLKAQGKYLLVTRKLRGKKFEDIDTVVLVATDIAYGRADQNEIVGNIKLEK